MKDEKPTIEEVTACYGVDPTSIGLRHRGWWIISEVNVDEEAAGVEVGDLCVCARDGGGNPIDIEALKEGNCITSIEDYLDPTYRYYYYRRLKSTSKNEQV